MSSIQSKERKATRKAIKPGILCISQNATVRRVNIKTARRYKTTVGSRNTTARRRKLLYYALADSAIELERCFLGAERGRELRSIRQKQSIRVRGVRFRRNHHCQGRSL